MQKHFKLIVETSFSQEEVSPARKTQVIDLQFVLSILVRHYSIDCLHFHPFSRFLPYILKDIVLGMYHFWNARIYVELPHLNLSGLDQPYFASKLHHFRDEFFAFWIIYHRQLRLKQIILDFLTEQVMIVVTVLLLNL